MALSLVWPQIQLLGKYLDLSVWETIEIGFNNTRHTCLASNALLKLLISLNSNPPLVLDSPSFSHFLQ